MNINKSNIDGDYNLVVQGENNKIFLIDAASDYCQQDLENSSEILKKRGSDMDNNNNVPTEGANIYLSINYMFETWNGRPTGKIEGVCLGVHVTNLNIVHRYFSQPSFKVSVPLVDGADTFSLLDTIGEVPIFPKRLEYGESYTIYYKLMANTLGILKKGMSKDEKMNIKAFVKTSLGECFYSNEQLISELTRKL